MIRLSQLAGLELQPSQMDILAKMNSFNIEGRYPDTLSSPPYQEEAPYYINKTDEVFKWLNELL